MNANELADEVEMWGRDLLALNMKGGVPCIEGAKMLRKQAKEIEYWKEKFEKAMQLNDQVKYLESKVYGGTTK
jgi:hypothetical protein